MKKNPYVIRFSDKKINKSSTNMNEIVEKFPEILLFIISNIHKNSIMMALELNGNLL